MLWSFAKNQILQEIMLRTQIRGIKVTWRTSLQIEQWKTFIRLFDDKISWFLRHSQAQGVGAQRWAPAPRPAPSFSHPSNRQFREFNREIYLNFSLHFIAWSFIQVTHTSMAWGVKYCWSPPNIKHGYALGFSICSVIRFTLINTGCPMENYTIWNLKQFSEPVTHEP